MKAIETLKQEDRELLENYKQLENVKKEVEASLKELKPLLMEKFKEPIMDADNQVQGKFTTSTVQRKELDLNKLLKYITEEQLSSCYKIKETTMTKITIGKLKD